MTIDITQKELSENMPFPKNLKSFLVIGRQNKTRNRKKYNKMGIDASKSLNHKENISNTAVERI